MTKEQIITVVILTALFIVALAGFIQSITLKKKAALLHELFDAYCLIIPNLRCPQCRAEVHDDAPRTREFGLCNYYCKVCGHFTHAVNDPEDQSPYPQNNSAIHN